MGELGKAEAQRNDTARRQAELVAYSASLTAELERLARAKAGASVFADLRVTHCPACDQEVPDRTSSPDRCSVCGQIHVEHHSDDAAGARRIEFEEQQVAEEREELNGLVGKLDQEMKALSIQIANINHRISTETRTVAAAQSLAVRAVPPDIALLDQEVGQIDEQLQQLSRVERAIGSRDEMSAKIAELNAQIVELDIEIKRLTPTIDFGSLGDLIADRMNDYLNLVNTDSLSRWKTGRVTVRLRREDFEVYLDNQRWTVKAGGTAACMIQIAYHYALLSLTKDAGVQLSRIPNRRFSSTIPEGGGFA
jgi:predicted  nucleic acid-binding Zn-ribbon protein